FFDAHDGVDDVAVARPLDVVAIELGHLEVDGFEQTGAAQAPRALREAIGREELALVEVEHVVDDALPRLEVSADDDLAELEAVRARDRVVRLHPVRSDWRRLVVDERSPTPS